jgi:hypothetical protein
MRIYIRTFLQQLSLAATESKSLSPRILRLKVASFCRETDKALLFNELTRSSGDGVAAQLAVVCENLRDARGSVLSFRAWLAA